MEYKTFDDLVFEEEIHCDRKRATLVFENGIRVSVAENLYDEDGYSVAYMDDGKSYESESIANSCSQQTCTIIMRLAQELKGPRC